MSRRYRAMLTKYNIAYNGNVSYKEGMESINKANKDDYSDVIHLFQISNHNNTQSASGNMDRVIEKSRKAIKLHSIKKKPERDYRKMNDPAYRAFYNQNEFNPELKKAWLQLGRAEFYKGDFLGSVGTFSYITRHYASTPEVVQEAQIWIARAYSELDWLYEAENVLKKIKPEQVFPINTGLYASTCADLLIKQDEVSPAIPYLKTAIEHEKNKKQRTRFNFVMAQLLERTDDKQGANEYYSRVISSIPSYEMDFNARINRAQMLGKNASSIENELKRMARNRNNKDYLDQIYTALGNVFMHEKDSIKAIDYYNLAIKESTRNGVEKGVPLVTMGDLYYTKREYVKAHPYYDEASKIYTNEYDDYTRISHRAEILADLVKEYEVVHLQDSLQALATMSEKDRLMAINRIIEQLKEEEKAEEESKLIAQNPTEDNFQMPMQPIGAGAGDWYFYNPMTVSNGKTEFRRRWGNRKLEDNWRRGNKSTSLFAENEITNGFANDSTTQNGDSISNPNAPAFKQTTDKYSVDYYLSQIPFTAEQKQKSDEQIATGLYNMAFVYKDKIEDYPLAYKTFKEFQRRFGTDDRILETLYQRFLLASKENNPTMAATFRDEILTNYADSKYAEMLTDPDFIRNQQHMFEEQDRIYDLTYSAFTRSDYKVVFANTEEIRRKYPLATLLPQFEFLNTLSIGKTEGAEKFEQSLNTLVENYPDNNISALSKDILALLKQGNIARQGETFGSLLTKRKKESLSSEEQIEQRFSEIKFVPHRLMLITDADNDAINKLQYNLAIFNFSRFMIKDFGFAMTQVDGTRRALSVLNLASYNEGIWYQNTLETDKELGEQMKAMNVEQVLISEENFEKLRTTFTLDDYLAFQQDYLSTDVPNALLTAESPKSEKKLTTVEIIDGTKLVPKKTETKPEEVAQNTPTETPVNASNPVESPKQPQPQAEKEPDTKPAQKTTEKEQIQKQTPTTQQQISTTPLKEDTKPIETPKTENQTTTTSTSSKLIGAKPAMPENPENLYEDLFVYRANAPHFTAFYIPRGGRFDFGIVKKVLDEFNGKNYSALNLKVTLETFNNSENIIFVGSFTDANVAKSYFLRVLHDPDIVRATSGMNKRNLIITAENLNMMLHNNALSTYFEFMKEYYLSTP
ncbi:MAG: hypothetical protein ACK5KP_05825 [Paludibacteraceae bacterium]